MTMTTTDYNQVTVLPWLSVGEIKIGDVIFWKFKGSSEERSIREYLEKYVACYVDIRGKRQENIMIASFGDKNNFTVLSPLEQLMVKVARDLLCFASIAPHSLRAVNQNNRSIAPPSSERFQMFSQNFIPSTDDIAFRAGSHTVSLSGGWKLDEVRLVAPLYLGGSLFSIDTKVLSALSKLLPSLNNPKGKAEEIRLLRSLEWFRLAHVENDEVSVFSKVVMMSTAFEVLYDVPNIAGKSDYIADKIDSIFTSTKLIKTSKKIGKVNKEHTLAGWWGWDFYKLRNRIVHGDSVDAVELIYKDWLTHLIIADLVFLKSVIKDLYSLGYYARDVKRLFEKSPDQEAEENTIDFVTGFSGLFKHLGWEITSQP